MHREIAEFGAMNSDPVRGLLEAWDEGRGDLKKVEEKANGLFLKVFRDEGKARLCWSAVERVAAGPGDVPAAHLILQHGYQRGWVVEANPEKALHHLGRAIDLGSDKALWYYACFLLDPEKATANNLVMDVERGLAMHRALIKKSKDQSTVFMAKATAAECIAKTYSITEVSTEDRKIVDEYTSYIPRVLSNHYLALALFYAGGGAPTSNALTPEYKKSRELLLKGSENKHAPIRDARLAQLDEWGATPIV